MSGFDYADSYAMTDINEQKKDANTPLNVAVKIPDKNEEDDFSWRKVLYEFSQSTTLSGVNKITESTPFKLRRLVWVILVIAGITAFVYQVILSVVYYYSWPVSVNVRVNYNSTISFPAVTICNQNAFRISKSVEHGVYDELTEAFSSRGIANVQNQTALAMSMTELYNKTSHTLDDMILSCTWDTKPCKASALSQRITDHGYCVTFNGKVESDPDHVVYRRGSSGGLSLKLNIEQYEYMSGPQQGAGIQMLMHDSAALPEVASLGQMFPPGIQASIGLSIKKIINLERPYGVCVSDRKLDYYPEYSLGACKTEGLQKFLRSKCGCRDPYMADDGETPICTLEQYVTCLKPSIDAFSADMMTDSCEIPCVQTMYEPTVSYGSLSRFDLEKMLSPSANVTDHIVGHYHHALEVRQRVDGVIVEEDNLQFGLLVKAIDEVDVNFKQVGEKVHEITDLGMKFVDRLLERLNTIRYGPLRLSEYIMQYNYVRGYVLIQERQLNYVLEDPYYFKFYFEENMKTLMSNETVQHVKESIYYELMSDMKVRRMFANASKTNITNIFAWYANGTAPRNYKLTRVPRYDAIFNASCVAPLGKSESYYIKRLQRFFGYLVNKLNDMELVATQALNGSEVDMEKYNYASYKYGKYMNQMNSDVYKLEKRVVFKPLEAIQKTIVEFEQLNSSVREAKEKLLLIRTKMLNISDGVADTDRDKLHSLRMMIQNYLRSNDTTKLDLALFTTPDVQESVNAMGRILWSIPVTFQNLASRYRELLMLTKKAYEKIFDQICMWELLKLMNTDIAEKEVNGTLHKDTMKAFKTLLRQSAKTVDLDNVSAQELREVMNVDLLESSMDEIRKQTESIAKSVEAATVWFHHSEETAATLRDRYRDFDIDMRLYSKGSRIDHDFLKDNILKISIYMRELSYSETEQQKAYEMTRFWSDVGGSMGLFIGASALTICEIIDFLMHSFAIWRRVRAKQANKEKKAKLNGCRV